MHFAKLEKTKDGIYYKYACEMFDNMMKIVDKPLIFDIAYVIIQTIIGVLPTFVKFDIVCEIFNTIGKARCYQKKEEQLCTKLQWLVQGM